jgi:hypothetical protein
MKDLEKTDKREVKQTYWTNASIRITTIEDLERLPQKIAVWFMNDDISDRQFKAIITLIRVSLEIKRFINDTIELRELEDKVNGILAEKKIKINYIDDKD